MEEEVLVLVEVTGFNPTGITPAGWPARGLGLSPADCQVLTDSDTHTHALPQRVELLKGGGGS